MAVASLHFVRMSRASKSTCSRERSECSSLFASSREYAWSLRPAKKFKYLLIAAVVTCSDGYDC